MLAGSAKNQKQVSFPDNTEPAKEVNAKVDTEGTALPLRLLQSASQLSTFFKKFFCKVTQPNGFNNP